MRLKLHINSYNFATPSTNEHYTDHCGGTVINQFFFCIFYLQITIIQSRLEPAFIDSQTVDSRIYLSLNEYAFISLKMNYLV